MRMTSVYEITCLCGKRIETDSITFKCQNCGSLIELDWRSDSRKALKTPDEPKKNNLRVMNAAA